MKRGYYQNLSFVTIHVKLIFILLLTFINCCSLSLFAQLPDIEKVKFGRLFINKNYHPKTDFWQYYYDDSIDSTLYCCPQNRIIKHVEYIKGKAKKYISDRAGRDFYKSLKLTDFAVIYHNYHEMNDFYNVMFDIDEFDSINYWLMYSYFADSVSEYGFEIELDKEGNCVSELNIPDKSKNKSFREIIPYYQALNIAKEDFKLKPIESIKLTYCGDINSFCWLITEDSEPQIYKKISEDEILIIRHWYLIELLYINAQTGNIFKKDYESGEIEVN